MSYGPFSTRLPDPLEIMEALAEEEWYGAVAAARLACEKLGAPAPQPPDLNEAEADGWEHGVQLWVQRDVQRAMGPEP